MVDSNAGEVGSSGCVSCDVVADTSFLSLCTTFEAAVLKTSESWSVFGFVSAVWSAGKAGVDCALLLVIVFVVCAERIAHEEPVVTGAASLCA